MAAEDVERGTRILLIGGTASELCIAAGMARDMGAEVLLCSGGEEALAALRTNGADLVMVEVTLDVRAIVRALRAERMTVPVLGCGVNAPAERAVAAIRAGAYDFVPLPPDREMIAAVLLSIGMQYDPHVDALVGRTVDDVERELILQTLDRCGGNRTSAATILGISIRTMRNKLRMFIDAGYPVSPAV